MVLQGEWGPGEMTLLSFPALRFYKNSAVLTSLFSQKPKILALLTRRDARDLAVALLILY